MTSQTTATCCPNCGERLPGAAGFWIGSSQVGQWGWMRRNRPKFRHGRILMPGGGRASKWWKVTTGIRKVPYCVHPKHEEARRAVAIHNERPTRPKKSQHRG